MTVVLNVVIVFLLLLLRCILYCCDVSIGDVEEYEKLDEKR